jgi:hypothetical protein
MTAVRLELALAVASQASLRVEHTLHSGQHRSQGPGQLGNVAIRNRTQPLSSVRWAP